jgi:hypothetical protein
MHAEPSDSGCGATQNLERRLEPWEARTCRIFIVIGKVPLRHVDLT